MFFGKVINLKRLIFFAYVDFGEKDRAFFQYIKEISLSHLE